MASSHASEETSPVTIISKPVDLLVSSMSQTIYDSLRQSILAGRIAPGTGLRQTQLASSYGVSITPIREALAALASDGLVDSSPFSGFKVHRPTLAELDDVYELRMELTSLQVRQSVMAITPEQLAQAAAFAEKMAALMQRGGSELTDPSIWSEANRDFHAVLDGACSNQQLKSMMARLGDLSRGYVAISLKSNRARQRQAVQEHRRLISLYRRRHVEGAILLSQRHFEETHRLVRQEFLDGC